MKIYLDTEFTDFFTRQLISIALVSSNGDEFYAQCSDFDHATCTEFVRETVLPLLRNDQSLTYSQLHLALKEWLNRYAGTENITICFDYTGDFELLRGALGETLPENISGKNIASEVTTADIDKYFRENPADHRHHALCDARALKHGHQRYLRKRARMFY